VETVYKDFARPPAELLAGYRELLSEYSPSCLVVDARFRMGAIGGLQPVRREHRIAGPALTVNLSVDDLVDCMPVLRYAKPGDVIVLACHGADQTAMWGALMTAICQQAGIAAGIVDGAIRDIDEIFDLGFPLWYRGTVPRPSPTRVHGRTEPVQVNVPVVVRGEVIEPGDLIVADVNGAAIIPPAAASDVLKAAWEQADKEKEVRARISSGATVADLVAEYGHL
jgi:regulator of RNase E activity RraA